MGDSYSKLFSICTILYILHGAIAVGILTILTKFSHKLISVVLTSFIIFKIFISVINSGFSLSPLTAYIGNFLGVLLGVLYFKYTKSIKRALLYLILIWLILNEVYSEINI